MKINNKAIEKYRWKEKELQIFGEPGQGNNGYFFIDKHQAPLHTDLYIIASDGMSWDHVSVSCKLRCPNWDEMCFVKDLFFEETECAVQYHPPKSEYINNHKFCLHLFRPQEGAIVLPPGVMVGIKE